MHTLDVIVETPKNNRYKYTYEPETKRFKMKKVLPAGLVFPYDFGYIPDTLAEDGDPIDILIFSDQGFIQGCVVECKIIGAIKAEQTEQGNTVRNDRIIGIPVLSDLHQQVKSLHDISEKILKEIEHFFIYFNEMAGKKFEPLGIVPAEETWQIIEKQKV